MNNVILIGRLVKDPELKYLQNGTATCNFTLAVDKGLSKDKKQELQTLNKPTADFIRVVVWGKQAENAANYLAKGRLAAIQGRIQTGNYDKDGVKVYTTDIIASNVEFLEWGDKPAQEEFQYDSTGFHPTDNEDVPF